MIIKSYNPVYTFKKIYLYSLCSIKKNLDEFEQNWNFGNKIG